MKTIWKYPLRNLEHQSIAMPLDAEALCVQMQDGQACLWVICDPKATNVVRRVRIIRTGGSVPDADWGPFWSYVGTFQDGSFVGHVFMEK